MEDYHRLPSDFYTLMQPEGVGRDHALIHANIALASDLGLESSTDFARYFNGHATSPGFRPLAMVYAGHQFGSYVPRLGDGRALLIAQVRGVRDGLFDLQLKGSGRTPYSRFGDGRAVLRSTIREYLAGEAMHALGIPTSRALCCVATHEGVLRERLEPGAILTRVAPSHVRFGHFEYFHYTRRPDLVKTLADFVIEGHFPELVGQPYEEWFRDIVRRTAHLIASWQAVGFAHGVMNTDNMSILGLTLDYGPYGFLESFDPGFICNHSDEGGRYSFERQPEIAKWNLWALANALVSLAPVEALSEVLQSFDGEFYERYVALMQGKVGITDMGLIAALLELMQKAAVDYTLCLHHLGAPAQEWLRLFPDSHREAALAWRTRYEAIPDRAPRNPKYILRNWVAETAIRAVEDKGDLDTMDLIFRMLQAPNVAQAEFEQYATAAPPSLRNLCVSCSS